jgi:hypothetical protein
LRYLPLLLAFCLAAAGADFSYSLNMDQVKETSSLTNSFQAVETISSTVSMSANGTFKAERSTGLDRFTDFRSGTGAVNWRPIGGIEMSASFLQSLSFEDRFSSRVRDDRTNSATGSIRYARLTWLNTSLSVGLQNIDFSRQSGDTLITGNNDGDFYRVNATVTRTLFSVINTSFGFTENRTYGNETENASSNLSARMNYSFPDSYRGGSISAQVESSSNSVLYIDSLEKRVGESWLHSETVQLPEVIPGVFMDFTTRWTADEMYFENTDPDTSYTDPRNDQRSGRSLSSNLLWEASDNVSMDFSFSRTIDNRENTTTAYGADDFYTLQEESDNKQLNITLSYSPGGSRIVFQRLVELYSYDTDILDADTLLYRNDFDRDEYRELIGISASIPLSSRFTITCGMNGQERSTYYLMASQSANSKKSSSYVFNPGYRYDLGNRWKLSQNMKITASYTNYLFPDEAGVSDRLFRRLDESFSISRVAADSTTLGISHRFTFNDQGTFDNSVFLRSEETVNTSVTLDAGFHVSSSVGITPSYTYQYYLRNRMSLGIRSVDHIHKVGMRSSIQAMGGTLRANISRSFYNDPARDSYWIASVGFDIRM